jgi:hypothetical protein
MPLPEAAKSSQARDGDISLLLSHGMNKRALIRKIVARLTDELEVYWRSLKRREKAVCESGESTIISQRIGISFL